MLTLGTACLLPQDIEKMPDVTNISHPPRVVLESVRPADQPVIVIEKDCPPLQFRVDVADEDTDQKIQVRWFVNYPQNPEVWSNRVQLPADKFPLVRQVDLFELDPSDARLEVNNVYPVDVVVADEFDSDASALPANRAVKGQPNKGASTTYRWVVWIKDGICQGGG